MTPFPVRRAAATALLTLLTVLLIPAPASAGAPAASLSGVWPLVPRPPVVRGFEPPPKPWLPGHRGVDLLGSPGQQVRAAAAGTITYAGNLAGRGVVVVNHGATRTTYEPVVPTVHVGFSVAAGSVIGTLSAGGSHWAPRACLHWGLLRDDTYLDPLSILTASPIRLLPLTDTRPATSAAHPVAPADAMTRRPAGAEPTGDLAADEPADDQSAGGESGATRADRAERRDGSSRAGELVVGVAAVLTLAGGVLIRRH